MASIAHSHRRFFLYAAVITIIFVVIGFPVFSAQETFKIPNPEPQAADFFGSAVAIDGNTLVVGSIFDDGGVGAAYVFTRSGSTWVQQAKLSNPDPVVNDQFGASVAISGSTLVVGALNDNQGATNAGAVHIFTLGMTGWEHQLKLANPDPAANDSFGKAVALHNGTLAVSAWQDDDGSTDAGSVYIFTGSGAIWTQQTKLVNPAPASHTRFGLAIDLDGDTFVAGSEGLFDLSDGAGTAWVFTRTVGVWSLQGELTNPNPANNDSYGSAVAVDGDTVIVGDSLEAVGGILRVGAAYVFTRIGGVWTQQATLSNPNPMMNAFFAESVALDGDLAVVSSTRDNEGALASGAAYVFARIGASWFLVDKLVASDPVADDLFGFALAMSGNTVAVGVPFSDTGGIGAGSTYIFDVDITNTPPRAVDDTYQTNEDTTLTIMNLFLGVRGNDEDDEQPLTGLTVILDSVPANGSLVLNPNGTFVYTPDADFFGIDTFTYHLNDGTFNSNTALVTITVHSVNDEPGLILDPIPPVSIDAGPQTFTDWLTFIPGPPNEADQTVLAYNITAVTNPGIFAVPIQINAAGTLTFTPLNAGIAQVTIRVQDSGGTARGGDDTSQPYTFNIVIFDPSLTGAIRINKSAIPADDTPFNFNSPLGDFTLQDPSHDNIEFTGLGAGSYNFIETLPNDWRLVSIDCGTTTAAPTPIFQSGVLTGVTINLAAGETVSCTFNNVGQTGTLAIQKVVVGESPPNDWTFTVAGQQITLDAAGGTSDPIVLPAGNYTVSETTQSTYDVVATCYDAQQQVIASAFNSASVSVHVVENDSVTCIFENRFVNEEPEVPECPAGHDLVTVVGGWPRSVPSLRERGGNNPQTYEISLGLPSTLWIAGHTMEGHPYIGCSLYGGAGESALCNQEQQHESYNVLLNDVQFGQYLDSEHGPGENAWFATGPWTTTAEVGKHTLTFALTLDGPDHSVSYQMAVCAKPLSTSMSSHTITIIKNVVVPPAILAPWLQGDLSILYPVEGWSFLVGADSIVLPGTGGSHAAAMAGTNHTISEMSRSGWGSHAACTLDNQSEGTVIGAAVMNVRAGATCSFTNSLRWGTISINKVAEPSDGTVFSFRGEINSLEDNALLAALKAHLLPDPLFDSDNDGNLDYSFTLVSGESSSILVPAGVYSFSEILPPGWDAAITCQTAGGQSIEPQITGDAVSIHLQAGGEVACQFSNVRQPGSVNVDDNRVVDDTALYCPTIEPLTGIATEGTAPEAPESICTIPNQGRPTIQWRNDDRAQWYQVWIGSGSGTLLFDWFSKPDAMFANPNANHVECDSLICTLKPNINPVAGSYEVWMQAWGTPTNNPDDGAFSQGGPLTEAPSWNGGSRFEPASTLILPSTRPGAVSGLTVTVAGNGSTTFSWQAAPNATWYNVWVGTDGAAASPWQTALFDWMLAEELGCENSGTCTLQPGVKLSTGSAFSLNLPPGTYIWYVQSWGPGGLSTGGRYAPPLDSWVEAPRFVVD